MPNIGNFNMSSGKIFGQQQNQNQLAKSTGWKEKSTKTKPTLSAFENRPGNKQKQKKETRNRKQKNNGTASPLKNRQSTSEAPNKAATDIKNQIICLKNKLLPSVPACAGRKEFMVKIPVIDMKK